MSRDDLVQYLMLFVSQGVRVPEQAFTIARTIDLERFERTHPRTAALTVLRMGLQRRFGFLTIRDSLLEKVDAGSLRTRPAMAARRTPRSRLRPT